MKKIILLFILVPCVLAAQHSIVIKHSYYTMEFDTCFSSEIMGYYIQTTAHATSQPRMPRTGKFSRFTKDPLLAERVIANDHQYKTWNKQNPERQRDRGHINPFAAFTFSEDAALESMYYSNTAPQSKYFNEHQWQRVEAYILQLSKGNKMARPVDSIHVWTGILISADHPKKMNDVFEPDYYWKVISYKKQDRLIYEAWLGLNDDSNRDTNPNSISVSIETIREMLCKYYPSNVQPGNLGNTIPVF